MNNMPPQKEPVSDHVRIGMIRPSIASSFFAVSEKLASSRFLRFILIALLPVLILLAYPVDRFDYDMWWQMALGKYYITHHTLVVDHSIFSWTPADSGWIYNTCLGSIILYLIYSLMGGLGLWLFQWLIFLGIFFSFYLFLRLIGQRLDVTGVTIIAAVGISCSASCSFYKPELFSPLILSWMGLIFLYARLTHKKFLFYVYPLIFVFWVNLHGAFLLGFCFLACMAIGEILNRIFFPHESFTINELLHLNFAMALSLLAILINPYGINYLLSIYHGVTSESLSINTRYIQSYVSLWSHFKDIKNISLSFFKMGQIALIMMVMVLSLGSLFTYGWLKKRSCDFSWLILSTATFIGSMWVIRAVYMFPLVFFFSLYYMFFRLGLKRISARATLLSLLVFVLLTLNIFYFTLRHGAENQWFGTHLESIVPSPEVEFLKKYHPEGPLFNDYLIGGYLLWALYPDYQVFIDPRLVPYYKQVSPDYWELVRKPATAEDLDRFNKKYPFKTAIIHYRELPLIFDFLNAGWRILYFEKNAAILVHQSILSRIPPEVQKVDLGPMRFQDVHNPQVLLNVFSLYINLYPQAGPVIYDIYRKNVSDFYKPKAAHLRAMEEDIRQSHTVNISND